jgi:hypothetical protein
VLFLFCLYMYFFLQLMDYSIVVSLPNKALKRTKNSLQFSLRPIF